MPIYSYRCENCGHAQDTLQKMSDPLLTVCPACGQAAYKKQVTAAGFQLKGSGWYVTDFRSPQAAPAKPDDKKPAAADAAPSGDAAKSDTAPAPAPAPAPSTTADAKPTPPKPASAT